MAQDAGRRADPPSRGSDGRPKPPKPPTFRSTIASPRFWITLLVLLALNYFVTNLFLSQGQPPRVDISYDTFKAQVTAGNVASITSQGRDIQGKTRQPVTSENDPKQKSTDFHTVVPEFAGSDLEPLLEQHNVTVNAKDPNQSTPVWLTLLLSFGPTLLLVGVFVWLSQRAAAAGGGLLGFGRSQARVYDAERPKTTFADVADIQEAKEELQEVVDFLRNPTRYQRLGGTAPKGVLLVGPPGTGKTLLARAVAGEANVPFFSVSASEFVEMIVGVGASRVRDLFNKARQAAPAIIFIDELDAIGRSRSGAIRVGGHDEQEQTLNQILTEMDGFDSREGVIVLSATNRADVLDPALLRPGRFARTVQVHTPDRAGPS